MESLGEDLLSCLSRISADVEENEQSEAAPNISSVDLATVRSCVHHLEPFDAEETAEMWRGVVQSGQVSFLQLTKALGRTLRSPEQAWTSCAFYSTLLRLKGCPVSVAGWPCRLTNEGLDRRTFFSSPFSDPTPNGYQPFA